MDRITRRGLLRSPFGLPAETPPLVADGQLMANLGPESVTYVSGLSVTHVSGRSGSTGMGSTGMGSTGWDQLDGINPDQLISIFRGLARSDFGTVTVSTPFANAASTLSESTCVGIVKVRVNVP